MATEESKTITGALPVSLPGSGAAPYTVDPGVSSAKVVMLDLFNSHTEEVTVSVYAPASGNTAGVGNMIIKDFPIPAKGGWEKKKFRTMLPGGFFDMNASVADVVNYDIAIIERS